MVISRVLGNKLYNQYALAVLWPSLSKTIIHMEDTNQNRPLNSRYIYITTNNMKNRLIISNVYIIRLYKLLPVSLDPPTQNFSEILSILKITHQI